MKRRTFLATAPVGAVAAASTAALMHHASMQDTEMSEDVLPLAGEGGYLSASERTTIGAVFARLIPADDVSIGAVEAGCVDFLDRQLGSDWGRAGTRYQLGPFEQGTAEQGNQSPATPRQQYRDGVVLINDLSRKAERTAFADLAPERQEAVLRDMESGKHGDHAKMLFELMLQNVREGYFADPMYGGNKDMAGWKMVGFPGARYDYRVEVDRHGEDLKLEPISLMDRAS